ncbi:MAG: hypothetical protein ACRD3B_15230, partial [Candidatus Sulfotelmatobacter sp.]
VEGMPTPLARLDVGDVIGQEPWKHTIWVETQYLHIINPYRVFVVLDREYGERLSQLVETSPVWIVDTPQNRAVAKGIWSVEPGRSHLDGVTTFKTADDSSAEDALLQELETIDLHHGVYSANPPYTVVEVIGTGISDRVKGKFAEFGFDQFEPTSHGFRAIRPLPKNYSPDRWR